MSDDRNNPVGRFEIYVQDMRPAKAFYESVFGTQFTKLENPVLEPGMVLWPFPVQQTGYGATGALKIRCRGSTRAPTVCSCTSVARTAPSRPQKRRTPAGASRNRRCPSGHMATSRSSSRPKAT